MLALKPKKRAYSYVANAVAYTGQQLTVDGRYTYS
eukprot:SAG25_NODE_980_length_4429_cov_1.828176_1_plen_34_part_10